MIVLQDSKILCSPTHSLRRAASQLLCFCLVPMTPSPPTNAYSFPWEQPNATLQNPMCLAPGAGQCCSG
eukprot:2052933-Rhodomonas_salina.1